MYYSLSIIYIFILYKIHSNYIYISYVFKFHYYTNIKSDKCLGYYHEVTIKPRGDGADIDVYGDYATFNISPARHRVVT